MEGSAGGDADNMGVGDRAIDGAIDCEEGAETNGEEGSGDGEPFNSEEIISSDDGSNGGGSGDKFGKEK